ncbi:MAG: MGMT family protein, partial [bacterium]
MKSKKSFHEKLHKKNGLPVIGSVPDRMIKLVGPGQIVVPAPLEVDALIRTIPVGKLATTEDLRKALAKAHSVTTACPLVIGISCHLSAHAAVETDDSTPWWRVLKAGGELNPKFPGEVELQKGLLESEGHKVVQRGKKVVV